MRTLETKHDEPRGNVLHAVAPDLLEQLEALVNWADSKGAFAITQHAKTIIAKAKGE